MISTIKNFKRSVKEIEKDNVKYAKLFLKKNIYNTKKLHFGEKIAENNNNTKELWPTLKSLDLLFKRERQSKMSLKENGVVSYNSKDNANTFCRIFSNLADSLLQKLPGPKTKFGIKITEDYYKQIRNECEDFVLHAVEVTTVDKNLKNLDVSKVLKQIRFLPNFLNMVLQ